MNNASTEDTKRNLQRHGIAMYTKLRTTDWAAELLEAVGGVEGLDGQHAAASFLPEHDDLARAKTISGGEHGPPAPQECAANVPDDLDAPELAQRTEHERRVPSAAIPVPREHVGDVLHVDRDLNQLKHAFPFVSSTRRDN